MSCQPEGAVDRALLGGTRKAVGAPRGNLGSPAQAGQCLAPRQQGMSGSSPPAPEVGEPDALPVPRVGEKHG